MSQTTDDAPPAVQIQWVHDSLPTEITRTAGGQASRLVNHRVLVNNLGRAFLYGTESTRWLLRLTDVVVRPAAGTFEIEGRADDGSMETWSHSSTPQRPRAGCTSCGG
jgi:hypothetical protein